MKQTLLNASKDYRELDEYYLAHKDQTILLVCDTSLPFLALNDYYKNLEARLGIKVIPFDHFKPNPLYESVVEGVQVLLDNHCDSITAVGGGSAMDVAKCIKLYANMDHSKNYLEQTIVPNDLRLLAVPTTAGTGSEATRYAVIYYNGEKQSVTHESCIPSTVLMDPSVLKTLPLYQKKATMMDALCHSIESYWSVNSTAESQAYSKEAIEMIIANKQSYLDNDEDGNKAMLKAANIAGRAINITQTTAGHAMSYKITSLYGIAHGHAASLCIATLFPYMAAHTDQCIDERGSDYLKDIFNKIAAALGCATVDEAITLIKDIIFNELALTVPDATNEDIALLSESVNPVRLKNNPVALDTATIDALYRQILHVIED